METPHVKTPVHTCYSLECETKALALPSNNPKFLQALLLLGH